MAIAFKSLTDFTPEQIAGVVRDSALKIVETAKFTRGKDPNRRTYRPVQPGIEGCQARQRPEQGFVPAIAKNRAERKAKSQGQTSREETGCQGRRQIARAQDCRSVNSHSPRAQAG